MRSPDDCRDRITVAGARVAGDLRVPSTRLQGCAVKHGPQELLRAPDRDFDAALNLIGIHRVLLDVGSTRIR
jgi:hypothetical protein